MPSLCPFVAHYPFPLSLSMIVTKVKAREITSLKKERQSDSLNVPSECLEEIVAEFIAQSLRLIYVW